MEIVHIGDLCSIEKDSIMAKIKTNWGSTSIVYSGMVYDLNTLKGIALKNNDIIVSILFYQVINKELNIILLESFVKRKGFGRIILQKIKEISKGNKYKRIIVTTTNDNIDAIKFYQLNEFDIIEVKFNAVDLSRKIKPEIPSVGNYGIKIKHELIFGFDIEV